MATTGTSRMGARPHRRFAYSQCAQFQVIFYLYRVQQTVKEEENVPVSVAEISREVVGLPPDAAMEALRKLIADGAVVSKEAPGGIVTYRLQPGVEIESLTLRVRQSVT